MIEAQENERNRIARELHDDISQRMALLLISLDKMSHEPSDRVKHVTQQLQEIMKAASEISSDIHNLSHRLHPSKLEVLGLVAAVNGYCRELSAQQGLQIKFTHCEFPRGLPNDVTLCLYRIVQESLQKVINRSGVNRATVELGLSPDEMRLRVADTGNGFDVESATDHEGLGLISIRERLRLARGKLVVRSSRSSGTEIDVRIPRAEITRRSKEAAVGSDAIGARNAERL